MVVGQRTSLSVLSVRVLAWSRSARCSCSALPRRGAGRERRSCGREGACALGLSARAFGGSVALVVALASAACGAGRPPEPVEPAVAEVVSEAGAPPATPQPDAEAPPVATLFDRMGGRPVLTRVIDSFLENIVADPELKRPFSRTTGAKLEQFKERIYDQICELASGPCKYAGKDMRAAHKGMGVTDKQWDAIVRDLSLALREQRVGEAEQSELFALIAPMKDDVVAARKTLGRSP